MKRDLLIGIAIGAVLSSAAYVAASQFKPAPATPSATMKVYALDYRKPREPVPDVYAGIPDPLARQPSQAIVELAVSCGVSQYTLENAQEGSFSRIPRAILYIHPAKLSDDAFDCLSERVRPPYLTLSKVERCRRLMERNSDAPPCSAVVY